MAFKSNSIKAEKTKVAQFAQVKIARAELLLAEELRDLLFKRGYRYCSPKASTWRSALIAKHANSVLCVLFRKNGVDVRYYHTYKGEISIDNNNIASFIGGELFRNDYKGSVRIHRYILFVASAFASGTLKRSQLLSSRSIIDKAPNEISNPTLPDEVAPPDQNFFSAC